MAEAFLMCGPTNLDTAISMYNPYEKNSEKKGKMSTFCEPECLMCKAWDRIKTVNDQGLFKTEVSAE